MFCGNCGREISEESQFCPYCGAKISRSGEEAADPEKVSREEAAGDAASETPDPVFSGSGRNGKRGPGKGKKIVMTGMLCAAAAAAVIGLIRFRTFRGGNGGAETAAVSLNCHTVSSPVPSQSGVHASSAAAKKITPTPAGTSGEVPKKITPTPAGTSGEVPKKITPTPVDSSAAAGNANSEGPQGVSSISAAKITQVIASSTLVQSPYSYSAWNLTDGDLSTAWVEGADGTGIGENVTFTYNGVYLMQGFRIRNGYQKKSDLYTKNARPKTIELIFDDGSTQEFELADSGIAEQKIQLSTPVNSSSVTLVIRDVYPGTKYEDTAITEFGMY